MLEEYDAFIPAKNIFLAVPGFPWKNCFSVIIAVSNLSDIHKSRPPERVLMNESGQDKLETMLKQCIYIKPLFLERNVFLAFLVFLENCVCEIKAL